MKDSDWSFVLHQARGTGKTTAMIEAAKKIGAVLVVRNEGEALRVREQHGVEAMSMHSATKFRGINRPVLFDPDAVALMLFEKDREMEKSKKAEKYRGDLE